MSEAERKFQIIYFRKFIALIVMIFCLTAIVVLMPVAFQYPYWIIEASLFIITIISIIKYSKNEI
jgi:hypothetical protein